MSSKLKFKLVSKDAKPPSKATPQSAGFDLYSTQNAIIHPKDKIMISTGISLILPENTYGRVAPRSGLTLKHSLHVGAGVIDEDYRGEIKVILFNFGKEPYEVKKGDKIAQLIVQKIVYPTLQQIDTQPEEKPMKRQRRASC